MTAKGRLLEAKWLYMIHQMIMPHRPLGFMWSQWKWHDERALEELSVSVTSASNAWMVLGTATRSQGYTVPGRCPDYQLSESGCYLLSRHSFSELWTTGLFPLKECVFRNVKTDRGLNISAPFFNVCLWAWAALNYGSIGPILFSL